MIIYKITNKFNGKIYIGQTIRTLEQRWSKHKSDSRTRNYPIYLAIRKYGSEVFTVETLCTCDTQEELDKMEIYHISLYNTVSPNGYNLELGSNGKGKQTPETCLRISNSKKGIKRGSPSIETRNKMSVFAKNRTYSEETRVKMR